ncbi:hypothetical protein K239x_10900 [Planctomycetes bacterium K23_9]|uniref:DUF1571 domain-containing protein n=2 Tax=Stieleria marina TaxID=1930275 RepID=A0A517NPU4_9BACT|nr:hypothetical protein K239x_10900 [Planctomycetes bacterium K23_9]
MIVGGYLAVRLQRGTSVASTTGAPTDLSATSMTTDQATMSDVLDTAIAARQHISSSLNDYTATFVKQEADSNGVLGEETVIEMKIQTRLRNETDDAPMRVYLKFVKPEANQGREVLWGEDLYDGKMGVHEVGFLVGLKSAWIDPNGMLAMQGQRYPISEIGLTKLVEKLIERGEVDRTNPDVRVKILYEHEIDGTPAHLIQVHRAKPSGDKEEDFSLAEISIDPVRQVILQYRSFGWPANESDPPPLQESYTYKNLKTNVGLTEADFDYKNPAYTFP